MSTRKWKPVTSPSIRSVRGERLDLPLPLAPLQKKVNPNRYAKKRTLAEREADKLFIEHYAVRGYSTVQIAEELAKVRRYRISAQQVLYDLQAIKKEWREEAKADIGEYIGRELRGLERQERELWLAWEKSKLDAESETVRTNAEGEEEVTRTKEGQAGWVAFQNALLEIRKQRRELLGLDKPKKIASTTPDGEESVVPLIIAVTPDELPKPRKT